MPACADVQFRSVRPYLRMSYRPHLFAPIAPATLSRTPPKSKQHLNSDDSLGIKA